MSTIDGFPECGPDWNEADIGEADDSSTESSADPERPVASDEYQDKGLSGTSPTSDEGKALVGQAGRFAESESHLTSHPGVIVVSVNESDASAQTANVEFQIRDPQHSERGPIVVEAQVSIQDWAWEITNVTSIEASAEWGAVAWRSGTDQIDFPNLGGHAVLTVLPGDEGVTENFVEFFYAETEVVLESEREIAQEKPDLSGHGRVLAEATVLPGDPVNRVAGLSTQLLVAEIDPKNDNFRLRSLGGFVLNPTQRPYVNLGNQLVLVQTYLLPDGNYVQFRMAGVWREDPDWEGHRFYINFDHDAGTEVRVIPAYDPSLYYEVPFRVAGNGMDFMVGPYRMAPFRDNVKHDEFEYLGHLLMTSRETQEFPTLLNLIGVQPLVVEAGEGLDVLTEETRVYPSEDNPHNTVVVVPMREEGVTSYLQYEISQSGRLQSAPQLFSQADPRESTRRMAFVANDGNDHSFFTWQGVNEEVRPGVRVSLNQSGLSGAITLSAERVADLSLAFGRFDLGESDAADESGDVSEIAPQGWAVTSQETNSAEVGVEVVERVNEERAVLRLEIVDPNHRAREAMTVYAQADFVNGAWQVSEILTGASDYEVMAHDSWGQMEWVAPAGVNPGALLFPDTNLFLRFGVYVDSDAAYVNADFYQARFTSQVEGLGAVLVRERPESYRALSDLESSEEIPGQPVDGPLSGFVDTNELRVNLGVWESVPSSHQRIARTRLDVELPGLGTVVLDFEGRPQVNEVYDLHGQATTQRRVVYHDLRANLFYGAGLNQTASVARTKDGRFVVFDPVTGEVAATFVLEPTVEVNPKGRLQVYWYGATRVDNPFAAQFATVTSLRDRQVAEVRGQFFHYLSVPEIVQQPRIVASPTETAAIQTVTKETTMDGGDRSVEALEIRFTISTEEEQASEVVVRVPLKRWTNRRRGLDWSDAVLVTASESGTLHVLEQPFSGRDRVVLRWTREEGQPALLLWNLTLQRVESSEFEEGNLEVVAELVNPREFQGDFYLLPILPEQERRQANFLASHANFQNALQNRMQGGSRAQALEVYAGTAHWNADDVNHFVTFLNSHEALPSEADLELDANDEDISLSSGRVTVEDLIYVRKFADAIGLSTDFDAAYELVAALRFWGLQDSELEEVGAALVWASAEERPQLTHMALRFAEEYLNDRTDRVTHAIGRQELLRSRLEGTLSYDIQHLQAVTRCLAEADLEALERLHFESAGVGTAQPQALQESFAWDVMDEPIEEAEFAMRWDDLTRLPSDRAQAIVDILDYRIYAPAAEFRTALAAAEELVEHLAPADITRLLQMYPAFDPELMLTLYNNGVDVVDAYAAHEEILSRLHARDFEGSVFLHPVAPTYWHLVLEDLKGTAQRVPGLLTWLERIQNLTVDYGDMGYYQAEQWAQVYENYCVGLGVANTNEALTLLHHLQIRNPNFALQVREALMQTRGTATVFDMSALRNNEDHMQESLRGAAALGDLAYFDVVSSLQARGVDVLMEQMAVMHTFGWRAGSQYDAGVVALAQGFLSTRADIQVNVLLIAERVAYRRSSQEALSQTYDLALALWNYGFTDEDQLVKALEYLIQYSPGVQIASILDQIESGAFVDTVVEFDEVQSAEMIRDANFTQVIAALEEISQMTLRPQPENPTLRALKVFAVQENWYAILQELEETDGVYYSAYLQVIGTDALPQTGAVWLRQARQDASPDLQTHLDNFERQTGLGFSEEAIGVAVTFMIYLDLLRFGHDVDMAGFIRIAPLLAERLQARLSPLAVRGSLPDTRIWTRANLSEGVDGALQRVEVNRMGQVGQDRLLLPLTDPLRWHGELQRGGNSQAYHVDLNSLTLTDERRPTVVLIDAQSDHAEYYITEARASGMGIVLLDSVFYSADRIAGTHFRTLEELELEIAFQVGEIFSTEDVVFHRADLVLAAPEIPSFEVSPLSGDLDLVDLRNNLFLQRLQAVLIDERAVQVLLQQRFPVVAEALLTADFNWDPSLGEMIHHAEVMDGGLLEHLQTVERNFTFGGLPLYYALLAEVVIRQVPYGVDAELNESQQDELRRAFIQLGVEHMQTARFDLTTAVGVMPEQLPLGPTEVRVEAGVEDPMDEMLRRQTLESSRNAREVFYTRGRAVAH